MTVSDRLPKGPHGLPRAEVERSQRRRLIAATAHLVAEQGYSGLRVADLAALAGVSRSAFYDQFRTKEQLFLACYQPASDTHRQAVERALRAEHEPVAQIRAAISAYLEMLSESPDLARAFFIEAQYATPAIRQRFVANQSAYADLMAEWHADVRAQRPKLPDVPQICWMGVISGIVGLVTQHLESGSTADAPAKLTEPCVRLVLAVSGLSC
jgi:AcrR family transcriptional regulator